jgi:hypothetical protein
VSACPVRTGPDETCGVEGNGFVCDTHWGEIPDDLKGEIKAAIDAKDRPRYDTAKDAAVASLAWRPMPRLKKFEQGVVVRCVEALDDPALAWAVGWTFRVNRVYEDIRMVMLFANLAPSQYEEKPTRLLTLRVHTKDCGNFVKMDDKVKEGPRG